MQLDWFFGVVKRGYDAAVLLWARQSELPGTRAVGFDAVKWVYKVP